MQYPQVQQGDIFLTANPMWLGRAINSAQRFWSKDSHSIYSHAGIMITGTGRTYEALWTVKSQNLFTAYKGKQALIARHIDMSPARFLYSLKYIRNCHDKDWYPFYRLFFHLLPPLAKMATGSVVCSELVALFLEKSGIMNWHNGCNPDDLHDRIKNHRGWVTIFEGRLL